MMLLWSPFRNWQTQNNCRNSPQSLKWTSKSVLTKDVILSNKEIFLKSLPSSSCWLLVNDAIFLQKRMQNDEVTGPQFNNEHQRLFRQHVSLVQHGRKLKSLDQTVDHGLQTSVHKHQHLKMSKGVIQQLHFRGGLLHWRLQGSSAAQITIFSTLSCHSFVWEHHIALILRCPVLTDQNCPGFNILLCKHWMVLWHSALQRCATATLCVPTFWWEGHRFEPQRSTKRSLQSEPSCGQCTLMPCKFPEQNDQHAPLQSKCRACSDLNGHWHSWTGRIRCNDCHLSSHMVWPTVWHHWTHRSCGAVRPLKSARTSHNEVTVMPRWISAVHVEVASKHPLKFQPRQSIQHDWSVTTDVATKGNANLLPPFSHTLHMSTCHHNCESLHGAPALRTQRVLMSCGGEREEHPVWLMSCATAVEAAVLRTVKQQLNLSRTVILTKIWNPPTTPWVLSAHFWCVNTHAHADWSMRSLLSSQHMGENAVPCIDRPQLAWFQHPFVQTPDDTLAQCNLSKTPANLRKNQNNLGQHETRKLTACSKESHTHQTWRNSLKTKQVTSKKQHVNVNLCHPFASCIQFERNKN